MLVLGASAAMAVGPEIAVRLGEPAPAADGLTIGSTTDGSDALECLREGEWSVGQVKVKALVPAADGQGTITLRILGASERAPIPALVRRGPIKQADGQTPIRETYIRNAHREGDDIVATIPYPLVPGVDDCYDLVDQSVSVDWRQEPALEADPKDHGTDATRRALVLIPGDEEGEQGARAYDARLAVFRVLRESPAYKDLMATHKPYLFRYAAYRDRKATAAALTQLIRSKFSGHVALIAHGSGAELMQQVLGAPGMKKRVVSAFTLGDSTPASLLANLAAR